ncbi:DUF1684 domain-containing protein [Raineyella fluvialis]|uniref:DUF1684 domain-containing protein n=1 Tax=Raineyella fluvialis TaxID=2662261 RepID=A0A5Q2F9Z1_9ACTN|nr:DUF1684 domain-containing protein [Raineyella fluvialis]QGF23722.1 DUF1684 domain-containing protein [Raineyella fluvialis]
MGTGPDWSMWEHSEWKRWHRMREKGLTAPHGWLSITALHWLDDTPRPIEGFPGLWSGDGEQVRVDLAPEDNVLRLDAPISGTVEVDLEEDESDASLSHDGIVAEAGIRGGHPMVRLRNPAAPTLTGFTGVPTYDWDPAWIVRAHFERYESDVVRDIETAYPGVVQPMSFWGEVSFTRDDHDVRLLVSGGHGDAYVVFHDPTNGMDTADWRFVMLGEVDPAGGTSLDFNRALNFPAAFVPSYATCPRPVAENEIPFPVTAGERRPGA